MAAPLPEAVASDVRGRCRGLLDRGLRPADVVCDHLAAMQRRAGEAWLHGEWSVADEHACTAVVDSALMDLEGAPAGAEGPPVACVSAEGDWHGMTARMVAVVLASMGRRTVFLGPSLPAADLESFLRRSRMALAISCSTVAALPGAARMVEAAQRAGVATALGGHAVEAVPEVARTLGVPTAADPRGVGDLLLDPPDLDPSALSQASVAELDLVADRLAAGAAGELEGLGPSAVLQDAAAYLLGFARAAICFDDPDIVERHRGWLSTYVGARAPSCDPALLDGAVLRAARAEALDAARLGSVLGG